MRKFRRIASIGLVAAMVAASFAGCSSSSSKSDSSKKGGDTVAPDENTTYEYTPTVSDDGKVLNIYVWNTEFYERLRDCYPGYEVVSDDDMTGKIGDVDVKFTKVVNDDNAYQDNLDATLANQETAAADDKIDIFLVEADYALKYVNTNSTLALEDVGVSSSDLADQYTYTQDVVTDSNGKLKGSSWQGCPGALIYRADVAEEVLGTSDPDEVQAYVSDWDTFLETATTMKDAGYNMTATVNDTYRVFSNNVTSKWVVDGTLNVDDNLKAWVDMSKAMVDAGETTTASLWSDDWSKGFFEDGNVFCYFGPAWMIDFSMSGDVEGSVGYDGGWRITTGPQGFYWGGTWICAANGTDNKTLVADIIKTMTGDADVLTTIATEKSDFVNNTKVVASLQDDESFGDSMLGGQNPLKIFSDGVATVDLSNISAYDQGCNEEFQNAMKDYFDGNYATYEEALAAFATAINTKYPEVAIPE